MNTHVLSCPCGYVAPKGFGWLDYLEMQRLHNENNAGHAAVIELVMTR